MALIDANHEIPQPEITFTHLRELRRQFDESLKELREEAQPQTTPKTQTDIEEFVLRYQQGDEDAFRYIYEHYRPKIIRLSRRLRNEDLVSELYEVLLRVSRRFDQKYKTKFNTYFWKCARHHIGSRYHMQYAQKRGGPKVRVTMDPTEMWDVERQREYYRQLEEHDQTKTISLNISPHTAYDNDGELLDDLQDQDSGQEFETVEWHLMLEQLAQKKVLKPKEIKALKMLLHDRGVSLREIADELGRISTPAVHLLLRGISKRPNAAKYFREALMD